MKTTKEILKFIEEELERGITRNKVLPLDWAMDRIMPLIENFNLEVHKEYEAKLQKLQDDLLKRISEKSIFHVVNGKAPKQLIETYKEGEKTGRESMRQLAIEQIKEAFKNLSPRENNRISQIVSDERDLVINDSQTSPADIHISRICLVDETGRVYDRFNIKLEQSIQDDGRTLKLFISPKGLEQEVGSKETLSSNKSSMDIDKPADIIKQEEEA